MHPAPDNTRNPWHVLTVLVVIACAVAAWSVAAEIMLWQPPRAGTEVGR